MAEGDKPELAESRPAMAAAGTGRESRPHAARTAALAAAAGVTAAAMAMQLLWSRASDLLEESQRSSGLLPVILLGGLTALASLLVVVLVCRRLGRLLLSVRMTVALLTAAALLCLASLPFEQEGAGGAAGPAGEFNDLRAGRLFGTVLGEDRGKRVGQKCMVLVRTAGLTDISGSWAFYALLGMLVLSSGAGLIWRRPVGVREFGFLGAHGGVLLLLVGGAVGSVFGYRGRHMQLRSGSPPRTVLGESEAGDAFSLRLAGLLVEDLDPEYGIYAWQPGQRFRERLPLDGSRPGSRAELDGTQVEVLEFLPEATPEEFIENRPGLANPVVRVRLSRAGLDRELVLASKRGRWWRDMPRGIELRFERYPTEAAALEGCRLDRAGPDEKFEVVDPTTGGADMAMLPFGRAKIGHEIVLSRLGLKLKVLRWFSGAQVGGPGGIVQVPPAWGVPAALELQPVDGKSPAFWVLSSNEPRPPRGRVPAQLAGMQTLYTPERWPPMSVRVVEGPPGSFRLAELLDGATAKIRPLTAGSALEMENGWKLRFIEFIAGARKSYRPARKEGDAPAQPAVKLAVGRGALRELFWVFPRMGGSHEVLGHRFAVRAHPRGRKRQAVEIEIFEGGESKGTKVLETGGSVSHAGYTVHLAGVRLTGRSGGRPVGFAGFVVSRRPGLWAVYLGLVLIALGTPWLLWSRFRRVPNPLEES